MCQKNLNSLKCNQICLVKLEPNSKTECQIETRIDFNGIKLIHKNAREGNGLKSLYTVFITL